MNLSLVPQTYPLYLEIAQPYNEKLYEARLAPDLTMRFQEKGWHRKDFDSSGKKPNPTRTISFWFHYFDKDRDFYTDFLKCNFNILTKEEFDAKTRNVLNSLPIDFANEFLKQNLAIEAA